MFFQSRYLRQLEAQIKALENELRRQLERASVERAQYQAREAKLIDRLLAKNGVPEVDMNLKEPRDINNMALFEDIEPTPREPEDIIDARKGEQLDAFAG